MAGRSRALTIQEMRDIIRRHPDEFSGIFAVTAESVDDATGKLADFILSHDSVVDAIVATGLEIEVAAVARLGMFRLLSAADILARTTAAGVPWVSILAEELMPLCLGSGALQ
jgi:hypothetical protein